MSSARSESVSVEINPKAVLGVEVSESVVIVDEIHGSTTDSFLVNGDHILENGPTVLSVAAPESEALEISDEQPADVISETECTAEELTSEQISKEVAVKNVYNQQIHSPITNQNSVQLDTVLDKSNTVEQNPENIPESKAETEDASFANTKSERRQDGDQDTYANKNLGDTHSPREELKDTLVQVGNTEEINSNAPTEEITKLPKLSQELIVTVEKTPDVMVLTENLPEVLVVAEKLPELLQSTESILPAHSSRQLKRGQSLDQEEDISQFDDEGNVDDGGSTLTIGRTETLSKQSEVNEILHVETEETRPRKKRKKQPHREEDINESCISPFFIIVYTFLGCLIIVLIGVNFWFGFHLLLLIALLAVIALLVLLLTEFSEYHNLII